MHPANAKNPEQVKFIEEETSGKISWEKGKIADVLEKLKKGDTIVISEEPQFCLCPS